MNPGLAGEKLEGALWVKETHVQKKRRACQNYSPKNRVKSFSLIGMVSGEKKDNVSGTGTRGRKKLNFILKCYCFTKMIVNYFLQKIESHW